MLKWCIVNDGHGVSTGDETQKNGEMENRCAAGFERRLFRFLNNENREPRVAGPRRYTPHNDSCGVDDIHVKALTKWILDKLTKYSRLVCLFCQRY